MSQFIRPKKHLGQHFLRDENIARKIANSLSGHDAYNTVLEIGPGTGALTKWLISDRPYQWVGVEVDDESISYLQERFREHNLNILNQDFLKLDIKECFANNSFAVIGNFPYNISSQILFKVLEFRHQIPELVGMFQKEVGVRIASAPGSKKYGILSVLTQAFYDVELLFYVSESVFDPPPKVKSVVIKMTRKQHKTLNCDETLFSRVVKMAFNQRRKMLRNALSAMHINWEALPDIWAEKRAEQLDVADFVLIAQQVQTGLPGRYSDGKTGA